MRQKRNMFQMKEQVPQTLPINELRFIVTRVKMDPKPQKKDGGTVQDNTRKV